MLIDLLCCRTRTHVLADALHHGSAAAVLHNLGQAVVVAVVVTPRLAPAAQTAPGAHRAVAAPGHHLCVRHAAEQPRVCVQRSADDTDRIPLRR